MTRHSRSALAKAFILLLEKHGQAMAVKALAQEIHATHATTDIEYIMQEIAAELLYTKSHAMVRVKTAHDISATVKRSLQKMLKQYTQAKSITVDVTIDPDLLGGFTVVTPLYEVMDASIRSKLDQL